MVDITELQKKGFGSHGGLQHGQHDHVVFVARCRLVGFLEFPRTLLQQRHDHERSDGSHGFQLGELVYRVDVGSLCDADSQHYGPRIGDDIRNCGREHGSDRRHGEHCRGAFNV
jgi:hypothetical protein